MFEIGAIEKSNQFHENLYYHKHIYIGMGSQYTFIKAILQGMDYLANFKSIHFNRSPYIFLIAMKTSHNEI